MNTAVYINLRHRPDRRDAIEKLFQQLNLKSIPFIAEKHPRSGQEGCFESHLAVINAAYDRGEEKCWIFEDDAALDPQYHPELMQKAWDFMNYNSNWDIFYFYQHPDIVFHDIIKTDNPWVQLTHSAGTHSYVISRRGMEKVRKWKYSGMAIDNMYSHYLIGFALTVDQICQSGSSSDISAISGSFHSDLWRRFSKWYGHQIGISLIKLAWLFFILGLLILLGCWRIDR